MSRHIQKQEFLPLVVQKHLTPNLQLPSAYRQQNVIVMLDLKNYSRMTRQLINSDKADLTPTEKFNITQKVGELVRSVFNPTLEKLVNDGADLLKFGGDAIIISWPLSTSYPLDGTVQPPSFENDKSRVWLALKSCLEIFTLIKTIGAKGSKISKLFPDSKEYTPLSMHASFHVGYLDTVFLGEDGLERNEATFFGKDLNLVGETLNLANFADELIITSEVVQLLELKSYCVQSKKKSVLYKSRECFIIGPNDLNDLKALFQNEKSINAAFPPLAVIENDILNPFIDESVGYRVDENVKLTYTTFEQLREITCLFIGVSDPDHKDYSYKHEKNQDHIARINSVYIMVIESLQVYNGVLRQFSNDDKGITLICFFGTPPSIHENTSIPALKCCNDIQDAIKLNQSTLNIICNIGVSTGRIYSGVIGNNINANSNSQITRYDHAVLGEPLNMAARLMSLHHESVDKLPNRILCDKKTKILGKNMAITCEKLDTPILLKGWDEPLFFYIVTSGSGISVNNLLHIGDTDNRDSNDINLHDPGFDKNWKANIIHWTKKRLSGRSNAENHNTGRRSVLGRESKTRLVKKPIISCIVIEGVTGSGKTNICNRMVEYSKTKGWIIWHAPSFESESKTPYFAVRRLIRSFYKTITSNPSLTADIDIKLDKMTESEFYQSSEFKKLLKFMKVDEEKTLSVISLLSPKKDSRISTAVSTESVSEDYIEVLCGFLKYIGSFNRVILFFEDVQWQDSFSWKVTSAISNLCNTSAFVVLISRPIKEYQELTLKRYYQSILTNSSTERYQIGNVPESIITDNVIMLFTNQFGEGSYETLATKITKLIYTRTGGGAQAVDCMLTFIKTLIKSKTFDIKNVRDMDLVGILPKNAGAIINAQFDKLDSEFRTVLKTASLIGQQFNIGDMCRMNGLELLTLEKINQLDIYHFLENKHDMLWKFKNNVIQANIAATMTDELKSAQHAKIAEYSHAKIYQQYCSAKKEKKKFEIGLKLVRTYSKIGMNVETERIYKELPKQLYDALPIPEQISLNLIVCSSSDKNGTFTTSKEVGMPLIIHTLGLLEIPYPKGKLKLALKLFKLLMENQKAWTDENFLPLSGLPFMKDFDLEKTLKCLHALQNITDTCCKVQAGKHNSIDTLVMNFLNLNAHIAFFKMNLTDAESKKINDQNLSCVAINYVMMEGLGKWKIREIIIKSAHWLKPDEEDKLIQYLDEPIMKEKTSGYGDMIYCNMMVAVIGCADFEKAYKYVIKSGIFIAKTGNIIDMQTCTKMLGGVLTETAHFELFVPNLKKWVELEETLAVKGALLDKESISPYSYYILLMNEWLDVEDPEFAPILKFLTVRLEAEVQKPDHLGVSHSWCFLGLMSSQIFKNTDDDLVFADDDLVFEYLQLLLVSYEAIKKVDRKQIIITTTAQILLIIRSYMFMCIFKEPSQRIKETWMKIFQIIYLTGYKIPDFTILIGLRKTAHYIYKGFAQLDKHNNLTFCQKRKVKKSKGTVGDINMKEYDDVTMDYQRAIKEWKLAIGEYEERNVYKYSGILTTLKELILYYSKMVSPPIAPEYKEKITNDILEFYEFSNYEQSKNRVEHLLDVRFVVKNKD